MRPLARHLGARRVVANRLEFRDGMATGRLLDPVIRPRGAFARIRDAQPDGRRAPKTLARLVGYLGRSSCGRRRFRAAASELRSHGGGASSRAFRRAEAGAGISVRGALAGRHVMLIGVTGFIGKVWLANLLMDLPEIGRIYLLIRRQKSNPAERRLEKMVEESPVFDPLFKKYGAGLAGFLRAKVEVVEGDVTHAGLGLAPTWHGACSRIWTWSSTVRG